MADSAQTPEAVAFALLNRIASSEQWSVGAGIGPAARWNKPRSEILDAFAECLDAVKGGRVVPRPRP